MRSRASRWNPQEDRIGVLGFSAGGHLPSTAATHYDDGDARADDPMGRVGCRPDFAILIYPTINLTDEYGHPATRRGLLGDAPDPEPIEQMTGR